MRGSRKPRKSSSSPRTVLKSARVTMSANQAQLPFRNTWAA
jgi:hypothetical protein